MDSMTLFSVTGLPLIQEGDDLATLIVDRLHASQQSLQDGDILVIAQKVISKAEGRLRHLDEIQADERAQQVARETAKEPRLVQAVLDESNEVLRARPGLLVVEERNGWICANAGVDRSNVEGDGNLVLLPLDSDASARRMRERLAELTGIAPAVLINDSHGRPWRVGTAGVCIGCAGLAPVWDQRGLHDLYGYELVGSEECIADELSAAASLLMGQSDEGRPVIVIRGFRAPAAPHQPARAIQRDRNMDVFR
jgi:coenzyme F420-0:L-glutamate ligase/coenzyme F420-1:gamma-L-glutamate ligase